MYYCGLCKTLSCKQEGNDSYPNNCPCKSETIEKSKELYELEENKRLAYNSAMVEQEGYCKKTRIEETMDFMKRCGYKKIGFAFCSGLKYEVEAISKIFMKNGFEVNSVVCKCGSIPKEFLGLEDNEKVNPGEFEAMCNPIGQALLLNDCKTDFNVIVGLCVGHDSLFIKYSDAPVTVLAAKDRVTGHSPLAPVYLRNSYYKKKLNLDK